MRTMAQRPSSVIRRHRKDLVEHEQEEILKFSKVYYWGYRAVGKINASLKDPYGYDDKRGEYHVVLGDHLYYRFEILSALGSGSFGQVLECRDHQRDTRVAVKIIRNKKRFHKQAKIEVELLRKLNENDPNGVSNVIPILEHFVFRNHLCIVFPLASMNLYELIKKYKFRGFNLSLVVKFAVQILATLCSMSRLNIVHCDFKPENIVLKHPSRYSIYVIDFGSGCFESETKYTYIQSRFYRAPEVVLGMRYGREIDMWSFALILVEIFTGVPLFPGRDEHEQLACIMEVLGLPPIDMRENCKRRHQFFDSQLHPILRANPEGKFRIPGSMTLEEVTGCSDQAFLSFIQECLQWNPKRRMTPEKALEHPWIQEAPSHLLEAAKNTLNHTCDSDLALTGINDWNSKNNSMQSNGRNDVPPLQLKSRYHTDSSRENSSRKHKSEDDSSSARTVEYPETRSGRMLRPKDVIAAAKNDVSEENHNGTMDKKESARNKPRFHSPIHHAIPEPPKRAADGNEYSQSGTRQNQNGRNLGGRPRACGRKLVYSSKNTGEHHSPRGTQQENGIGKLAQPSPRTSGPNVGNIAVNQNSGRFEFGLPNSLHSQQSEQSPRESLRGLLAPLSLRG